MKKILTIIILSCIVSNVFANCTQEDVNRLNQKLSTFKTLSVDFLEGNKAGKMYILKPGMMRIDYEIPEKISIIIKDGVVTYYDYQLDEMTKIKQDPKFLTFLAKEKIDFQRDFDSFACHKKDDKITINLSLTSQEQEEINLKMHFMQYDLNKSELFYNNKYKSTLFFKSLRYNIELSANKFNFKDKSFYNIE